MFGVLKLQTGFIWIVMVTVFTLNGALRIMNYQTGIRATKSSNDLLFTMLPFWMCMSECKRRPSCTAISFNVKLHICYQSHDPDPVTVNSMGFVFSRKSDWPQEFYSWCGCEAGQLCSLVGIGRCANAECPWPGSPNNGIILGNTRKSGISRIAYLCDRGFTLLGNSSLKCTGNTWKGVVPDCQLEQ